MLKMSAKCQHNESEEQRTPGSNRATLGNNRTSEHQKVIKQQYKRSAEQKETGLQNKRTAKPLSQIERCNIEAAKHYNNGEHVETADYHEETEHEKERTEQQKETEC